MISCQKGPTRHAYAWKIGPFWQDTLEIWVYIGSDYGLLPNGLESSCNESLPEPMLTKIYVAISMAQWKTDETQLLNTL